MKRSKEKIMKEINIKWEFDYLFRLIRGNQEMVFFRPKNVEDMWYTFFNINDFGVTIK